MFSKILFHKNHSNCMVVMSVEQYMVMQVGMALTHLQREGYRRVREKKVVYVFTFFGF